MSKIITCPSCLGAKQAAPLGGMLHSCTYCKGIGSVEQFVSNESVVSPTVAPTAIYKDTNSAKIDSITMTIPDKLAAGLIDRRSKEYRTYKEQLLNN